MKKKFPHTTVAVKLRKSETRNEWYLYVEAYPYMKRREKSPNEYAIM